MKKKIVGLVMVVLLSLSIAVVARDIENWSSTANGTAVLSTDDAGTATFTVDAATATTLTLGSTAVTATGSELNIMSGVTATAAEINAVANPAVAAPAAATNTQVVTLDFTKSVMQLTAANGTTTITLANVASANVGKSIILVNVGGTNALAIAKTGNYYGTAAALADDESIVIYSTATNVLLSHGGQ